MNYFSASLAVLCGIAACVLPFRHSSAQTEALEYQLTYTLTPDPAAGVVTVQLSVDQPRFLLRKVRLQFDPDRFELLSSDGEIALNGDRLSWIPEPRGGMISWKTAVSHRRNGNGHDAWLDADWGLFRAEDLIPRAATRSLKGATSRTEIRFVLPRGWSAVTEYFGRNNSFRVDRADRRFDEPTGWIVIGDLGVRRDVIAGLRVAVAAPIGETTRRLEALALLRWTLPELARVLPDLPRRLTIVSAGEPMWRGALSAPASLFIHADRPLISENATSTLLHEVMHVVSGLDSDDGYDWIVEGMAEYYSLELLYRSDTISKSRYVAARNSQREWAKDATALCGNASSGATTALAVTLFAELDEELRSRAGNTQSLDDVLARIVEANTPVNLDSLRSAAGSTETLHTDNLPGCSNMTREQH
jgi:hypothetical protein